MPYITPNWSAPAHIKAFSSTRIGGSSNEPFDSMNLGTHVGDDLKHVLSNRQQFKTDLSFPNEPIWLDQIHSSRVINADTPINGGADGAFSKVNRTVCAVMSADCLPLLLTNQTGDQVAAIHVGWRGLASGIIEQAVSTFDCQPRDIHAWAGPCIGPQKFEINASVREQLGGPDSAYNYSENKELLANLYVLCKYRLSLIGVTNYSHSDACTYSNTEQFFSYRRDGQCGRMATVIWIDRAE